MKTLPKTVGGGSACSTNDDRWFNIYEKRERPAVRLFCFHYAGGAASIFRHWAKLLSEDIEVVAIQLPGREERFRDDYVQDVDSTINSIIRSVKSLLDIPFAVFGHSLGAVLSFEFIRELRNRNYPEPVMYMPAGRKAIHLSDSDEKIHRLPDNEFVERLTQDYKESLGATLENPELRELFLPLLRADFELCGTYEYVPGANLTCPVYAVGGVDDGWLGEEALQEWRQLTTGEFKYRFLEGDHFFIHSAKKELLKLLGIELDKRIEPRINKETSPNIHRLKTSLS